MGTHKQNCRIIADVMHSHGVRHIVCSPGSRNAPMLLAVDSLPKVETHIVIDERSAAFVALGLAQISREPVALVCTSGTALLNYAPAVAEAYYQGLPLIVISADRPERWIDQDDSQTLRQPGALSNFVKKSYDIHDFAADNVDMCRYANREVNDAMITALRRRRGPVHINVRLDEPLTSGEQIPFSLQRKICCVETEDILSKETVYELAQQAVGKRILAVAGFMLPDDHLNKAMLRLASLPDVYVMHETVSNLHLPRRHSAVDVILSHLTPRQREDLRPDIIITVGGALISRAVKEFLRTSDGVQHWAVGHSHTTVDCFNSLSLRIEAAPAPFLSAFAKLLAKNSGDTGYAAAWAACKKDAVASHNHFVSTSDWSDLRACQMIFDSIPDDFNVQLSNGTSVRYAQLCMSSISHGCYCNRGVSGIDGCLSTAIGAAMAYPETTVLVTGDMSMAYDIGALSIAVIPERLKIIVLNNQGGGIFRFIPSTRSLPERERYFCAPPRLPLNMIAPAYGFEYFAASSANQLQQTLPMFLAPRLAPAILEVVTPGDRSAQILIDYMNRNKQ
mgnify:FL=1